MSKVRKQIEYINTTSRWYLISEKDRSGKQVFRIRRSKVVDGVKKLESYPAKLFLHMDNAEIESLLIRLNASYEANLKASQDRYQFDHSYVNIRSMAAFEKQLDKNISDKSKKGNVIHMLNRYVFEFFIVLNKLPDPVLWYTKENEWGQWLLNKELSPSSIRLIVSTANRFNKFLVEKQYPEMANPRKLEPVGKLKLDKIDKDRKKLAPEKYIFPDKMDKIIRDATRSNLDVLPNILLAGAFGLRMSETLGLTKAKFLKNSLNVDEQGDRLSSEGEILRRSTKSNERRVPYWNITAKDAWALVQKIKPMHPDTLLKKVNDFLERFAHTSHDFRRTFITNAHRKQHWKDVQMAAGHTDPRTTMIYDQDDRNLGDEMAELD